MAFGNGSLNHPFDLATALSWNSYGTNNTVRLYAGTYTGPFTPNLTKLVTFEPKTTMPKIDGDFDVNGSDVVFKNMEFFNSTWSSRESEDENNGPEHATVNVRAPRVKFINCIIHDLKSPYIGQEAIGAEFYGCVLYHHGWLAPLRGHGHGLYCQNSSDTQLTIKDCIMFDCFGWGLHCYGGNGATLLKNIYMEGNTCFMSGSLSGEAHPDILLGGDSGQSTGCSIKSNMTYGGSVGVSFYEAGAALQDFTNNYCPNGKNQAWGGYTAVNESGNNWDTVGNTHFLRANAYDSNRANLTIYNQANANTVTVDVSGLGWTGTVNARNVQDYFTDVQALTVSGGNITVNMQAANRTVSTPVGWTAPAKTFPQFGCFILESAV